MHRIRNFLLRRMGRYLPNALRFLAHHNPIRNGRWEALSVIISDPPCRAWLASLENPTRTRRGFEIYTLEDDITSDWIKLHGQHEVATEKFILDHVKADGTFLDIGANIGYFSLLAASTGHTNVVAFEPQRSIANLLVKSVCHNRLQGRVRVEQVALSNVASTMKMTSCPGNTGHAQLTSVEAADMHAETVSVVVLDEWVKHNDVGRVSACKVDTEGAEYQVLAGMNGLLHQDGPALVVELIEEHLAEFNASTAMVLELLETHGYIDVSHSYAVSDDSNRYFVKEPSKKVSEAKQKF